MGRKEALAPLPKAFMDRVGVPLFPALSGVHQVLTRAGVRNRMKLLAAGKLINPGRQMLAFALGADAIYTARGFMLALGCIQAMQCGNNTCPTGITTHDTDLQRGLDIATRSVRIKHYVRNIEHDLFELLSATGQRSFRELTMKNLYIPGDSTLAPPLGSDLKYFANPHRT